jgi:hypothetical protein
MGEVPLPYATAIALDSLLENIIRNTDEFPNNILSILERNVQPVTTGTLIKAWKILQESLHTDPNFQLDMTLMNRLENVERALKERNLDPLDIKPDPKHRIKFHSLHTHPPHLFLIASRGA